VLIKHTREGKQRQANKQKKYTLLLVNQVNMKITAGKKYPTAYLMYNILRLKRPLQELTRYRILQRKNLYGVYSKTDTHVKYEQKYKSERYSILILSKSIMPGAAQ
jgi:hypothetical protein